MSRGYKYAKKHTILYKWKINMISALMNPTGGNCLILSSSEFSTNAKIQDKWGLTLYFNNGVRPFYPAEYLTMFISNLSNNEVTARVTFYVLNNKGLKITVNDFTQLFPTIPNVPWDVQTPIEKNTLLTNKSGYLPNDTLTICAQVTVTDDYVTLPIEGLTISSKSHMAEDYKELYISKAQSDVTIIVGDQQFLAHKLILGVRSPVLSAMFTHEMIEKKTNQVSISDIVPGTFEKLLQYIYTDEVTDLDAVAFDLLEAADKYQLQPLKKMCEDSLCRSLTCENAIKTMIFADRHNAKNLLSYVIQCIANDAENIVETADFKDLEKSSLGFELFKKITVMNSNKKEIEYIHLYLC